MQIGIWDTISLVAVDGQRDSHAALPDGCRPCGRATGVLELSGEVTPGDARRVRVTLERRTAPVVRARRASRSRSSRRASPGTDLPVELWWPNLEGEQPLYTVTCVLLDAQGSEQDRQVRRVGFKHVEWVPCEGAPPEADPWVCVVNGRPVFLQGVNFAPLCANFADLTREDYEKRLRQYRDLG